MAEHRTRLWPSVSKRELRRQLADARRRIADLEQVIEDNDTNWRNGFKVKEAEADLLRMQIFQLQNPESAIAGPSRSA